MKERYANPYVMGVILGLILLFTFYTMGRGVVSSSSFSRIAAAAVNLVAPNHAEANTYFSNYLKKEKSPLLNWLVFLTLGASLGGLFSAFISNRIKGEVARGPSIGVSIRLWLALGGGIFQDLPPAWPGDAPADRPLPEQQNWPSEAGSSCCVFLQGPMPLLIFSKRSGYNGTFV